MKKLKRNKNQPWLTPTGVEIPTHELRHICRTWDGVTWEAYLSWFESACHEKLVLTGIFDKICEEQTESIFEQFQQEGGSERRALCEQVLSHLPPMEAEVLRQYFLEGRTEIEIGFALSRSQTGISLIKIRALSRLKRGNQGDGMLARQYMKGESSSIEEEPRLWDHELENPLKESRKYNPENHRAEFEQIKTSSVRVALLELSELAQRILYLRFWCDRSLRETARILGLGANVIADIESASVTKLKRNAAFFEAGIQSGGESCV